METVTCTEEHGIDFHRDNLCTANLDIEFDMDFLQIDADMAVATDFVIKTNLHSRIPTAVIQLGCIVHQVIVG